MNTAKSTLATLLLLLSLASQPEARSRFNLFDPLFADDDSDAHTVSAASYSPPTSATNNFNRLLEKKRPEFSGSPSPRLPPTIDDDHAQWSRTGAVTWASSPIGGIQAKRQVTSAISDVSTGPLASLPAHSVTLAPPKRQTEPPRHWSALENYYKKLSQVEVADALRQSDVAYYPISQELDDGSSLTAQLRQAYQQRPIIQSLGGAKAAQAAAPQQPAPYLPSSSPPLVRPPKPAFYFDTEPDHNKLQQQPITIVAQPRPSAEQRVEQAPENLLTILQPIDVLAVSSAPNNNSPVFSISQKSYPQHQPSYVYTGTNQFDPSRRTPEITHIERLLARMKHQQDILGPLLDPRLREQSQEESYCGPRNSIAVAGRPLQLDRETLASIKNLSEAHFSQLLQGQFDVPVALSSGEFPSHMGLYNGTEPADDNFLCGATWVHERFALTLASCFKNISAQQSVKALTVRAGEWLVGRPRPTSKSSQAALASAMPTRPVARVHLFPRYSANSSEHDLALVEWGEPIEFVSQKVPYISPACQMQARHSLRTSACWTPVRNITFREEFDPHGEGETVLVRNATMVEVPVRLYANDELKCATQTRLQYFNLLHPNYICSDSLQSSAWRTKLNKAGHFGSGIYCNENGLLNLVSILHPIQANSTSALGYLDLSYYKPWMRNVIWGQAY